MDDGFFANDYMSAVTNRRTPHKNHESEPASSKGNRNSKGHEKNIDQRRRQLEPEKFDYSHEPDVVDELLKIIEKQGSKIEMLEKRSEVIEKRSNETTKEMAKVVETKGNLKNVNDRFANVNVTERFNNLYDDDWAKLSKWLGQTFPTMQEIEMIHTLTTLMRNGYRECVRLADDQIRHFLLLDESIGIPTNEIHQELYAVRKTYTHTSLARTKIKRVVLDKILHAGENIFPYEGDKHQETEQRLQEFLAKYVDCCWLMVVSNPPISLNFDVIGKPYCRDHFRKFFLKKPVEDETKLAGTVYEIVWPTVLLQNGPEFYRKGDVIVVTKGYIDDEKFGNSMCCCFSSNDERNVEVDQLKKPHSLSMHPEMSSAQCKMSMGMQKDTSEHNTTPNHSENLAANKGKLIKPTGMSRRPKRTTTDTATVDEIKDDADNRLSSTTVIERFQSVYVKDWSHLKRWMVDKFLSIPEHQIIHHLTAMLKNGYQECKTVAESQIRQFLMTDESAISPTYEQDKELFSLRWKRGSQDSVKRKITREISEKLLLTENVSLFRLFDDTTRGKLQHFLNEYLDCCWLMVISAPPVMLNFDVVGQAYNDCKEQFRLYIPSRPVVDKTNAKGTVYEVVWPSVCLQDGSKLYTIGDVIVV